MVAPVTGPFTRTTNGYANQFGFNSNVYYRQTIWYRQRKPYDLPLTYSLDQRKLIYMYTPVPNHRDQESAPTYRTDLLANATNKAYAKLVDSIGDASLWAVNVAEYKQSLDLIESTAITLWRFCKALHRFDFPEAARILRTGIPPGLKKKAKSFGDNFLKFHFGWEPLVKDIGAAINTLQSPINSKRLKGRSGKIQHFQDTGRIGGSFWSRQVDNYFTSCQMGCTVTVTNPNLYLAQQLGFVNPLAVAWELVKFSFVVDWFVNVGQVIGAFTDFAGLSISGAYTSYTQRSSRQESFYTGFLASYESIYMRRTLSITGPVLHARPWKGVSVVRAATAISLLVQQLR